MLNYLKRNIPNALTCGNLLCGCLGICDLFENSGRHIPLLMGLACIFDFLDGFLARILKVKSAIGKDLDSLADMVTFGLLPGMLLFVMAKTNFLSHIERGYIVYEPMLAALPYFAFIVPLFSAIRLAKFNNDPRQTESFIGLPTPANAVLITSFFIIFGEFNSMQFGLDCLAPNISHSLSRMVYSRLSVPLWLIVISLISAILLLIPYRLFSLKFHGFSLSQNKTKYAFLLGLTFLLIFLGNVGIPFIILLYFLLSIPNNLGKSGKL